MQLLRGRTNHIWHLAISPDGSKLVAGGSPIHVWDLNDSKSKPQLMSVGERGSWGHEFQFLSATQLFVKTSQPDRWYRCDLGSAEVIELAPNEGFKGDACVHLPSNLLKGVVLSSFPLPASVMTYRIGTDGLSLCEAVAQGPAVRRVFGFTACGSRYLAEVMHDDGISVSHHLFDTISDSKVATFATASIGPYWNLNGWCFSPGKRSRPGGDEGRRGGPGPRGLHRLGQHRQRVAALLPATRHHREHPLHEPAARRPVRPPAGLAPADRVT